MKRLAQIEQCPVGQGGFTIGWVETDRGPFRWVYDCGSDDQRPLQDEIRLHAQGGDVDVLFLSHLHADHVNGVDALLSEIRVTEVVLPYLGQRERILMLAREAARGVLRTTFRDFLDDPAKWFVDRGVERIRFVSADDPDSEPEGREEPPDLRPRDPSKHKWSGLISADHRASNEKSTVGVGRQDAYCRLPNSHSYWVFWPQAYKPSSVQLQRFRASLHTEFGRKDAYRHYAEAARSSAGREKLRAAYDAIWSSDHNLVSMSVYAGPERPSSLRSVSWFEIGEAVHWSEVAGGWLLTGDANLVRTRRRNAFLSRYAGVLPDLDVFQLPHHGSSSSGDLRLFQRIGGRPIGFAAASTNNKYEHPDASTKADYRRVFGRDPHQVSEDGSTRLVTTYFER
ncbi:MAG: MBL fold metallo-hydrolase [Alphaproteobacteria bacterium]|nr:MBL fold metallo-hydrolase [Alphaproteobacteria bacterium]